MASSSQNQSENQSTSYNQSANQASSASQSTSFIPEYSQTPILESIAKYAEGMAPQVYQWGMDVYGKNQGDINDLMRTAETYASGQRLAADMGMAESGVQQAGESALENSKQDLMSYGIDPSSGRYAALDKASKVQTAAAAAGAGNQQRQADIATGNAMKNQAISAGLQNAQFGLGVGNDANQFLSTAIRLPYSPLGTKSASASQSSGQSQGASQSSGYSIGGSSSTPDGGGGGGGGSKGGGGGQNPQGQGGQGKPEQPKVYGGPGGGGGGGGGGPGGGGGGGGYDPETGVPTGTDPWYNGTDPVYDPWGGTGQQDPWGAYNPDTGGGGGPFDPGGGDVPWGGDFNPTTTGPGDTNWDGGVTLGGDTWGGGDTGGDWSGDAGYAEGGPVPDEEQMEAIPQEGGNGGDHFVSPSLSPSNGADTDDVPARLQAGEFVLPDDVVRWKGEEFFQNLISKSRQARENIMQVHGQMQGQQEMNLGGAI